MLGHLTRRLLFLLRICFVVLVKIPFWTITSLPRSNRPRPTWSVKRALFIRFFQAMLDFGDETPFVPNHCAIQKGRGVKAVWIAPMPHLIRGDVARWAEEGQVKVERVPAYWFEKKDAKASTEEPSRAREKIIYSLHGGAYAKMSAHPDDLLSTIRHGLLEHTKSIRRLLNLEYRLARRESGRPINPFPTQLLDAIAGYVYLVDEAGFEPEDIILMGDSAGGNLALALVRYIVERKEAGDADIPDVPSGIVLFSPWVDLGVPSMPKPTSSVLRNRGCDYLDVMGEDMTLAVSYFMGHRPLAETETNPYISPASLSSSTSRPNSFQGFPRTLIVGGGAETLRDQIQALGEKMSTDIGSDDVCFLEYPDAVHDFCAFTWHEPERTQALEAVAQWMEAL